MTFHPDSIDERAERNPMKLGTFQEYGDMLRWGAALRSLQTSRDESRGTEDSDASHPPPPIYPPSAPTVLR